MPSCTDRARDRGIVGVLGGSQQRGAHSGAENPAGHAPAGSEEQSRNRRFGWPSEWLGTSDAFGLWLSPKGAG